MNFRAMVRRFQTAARHSCVAPTNNKAKHESWENSGHIHDSSITVAGFINSSMVINKQSTATSIIMNSFKNKHQASSMVSCVHHQFAFKNQS
jgi:ribosomal protein S7